MNVEELLRAVTDRISAGTTVDPVVSGSRTVIPAAQVRYAFGAGGGGKKDRPEGQGGGGGARVSARPAGALEITPDGTRFIAFGGWRTNAAALAAGLVLGAVFVSLTWRKRQGL